MLFNILLLAVVHAALASPEEHSHVVLQKPQYSPAEAVSSQSFIRQHQKTQIKYEIPNLRHVLPIQQKPASQRVQYITPAPEKYFVPARLSYPSSTATPLGSNSFPGANHQQYSSSSPEAHPGIQYVQQYQVASSNENPSSESKFSPQGSQGNVLYKIPIYSRYTQVAQGKEPSSEEQGQTQAVFSKQNEDASYEAQPGSPASANYATQAVVAHYATPAAGHYATPAAGRYATPTAGHYATSAAVQYVQSPTYVKYAPETIAQAAAQQPQEGQYPKYRVVYTPAAQQESAQQQSAGPNHQNIPQYSGGDHAQAAYNVFANIKAAQYQPDDGENYKIVLSTQATPVYEKSAYPQRQQALQYYSN